MPEYILQGDYPLKVGGKRHEPGSKVKLDEEIAEPLVQSGRLSAGDMFKEMSWEEIQAHVEKVTGTKPKSKKDAGELMAKHEADTDK